MPTHTVRAQRFSRRSPTPHMTAMAPRITLRIAAANGIFRRILSRDVLEYVLEPAARLVCPGRGHSSHLDAHLSCQKRLTLANDT